MTYDELVAARDYALRQKESALAQANYAAGRASVFEDMITELERQETADDEAETDE